MGLIAKSAAADLRALVRGVRRHSRRASRPVPAQIPAPSWTHRGRLKPRITRRRLICMTVKITFACVECSAKVNVEADVSGHSPTMPKGWSMALDGGMGRAAPGPGTVRAHCPKHPVLR
jgi:hypothetical protein